jgi:hypothetical protein
LAAGALPWPGARRLKRTEPLDDERSHPLVRAEALG